MKMNSVSKYVAAAGSAVASAALLGVQTASAATFKLPSITNDSLSGSTNAENSISTLATKGISIILTIAGVLAVFYLIYSGILYITAGGNPEATKKARAGIINAIIGVVVVMAAFVIVRFAASIGNTVQNSDQSAVTISVPVA